MDGRKQLSKLQMLCGVIYRTLANRTEKYKLIKFNKTMTAPISLVKVTSVLYG